MGLESRSEDTICAIATPPGVAGISVIRISGPMALFVTKKIAPSLPNKPESHRAYFCRLQKTKNSDILDEVLITYFADKKSFTGEEVCEISCHGNPIICENILEELISAGARTAEKGEFTFRAFMNGKIDLVQAESVLSTIHAQSKRASILSTRNLSGALSKELRWVEDKILNCLALIETSIDFTTEDIDIIDKTSFLVALQESLDRASSLVNSYQQGRIINDGLQIILVGLPNVGKSSLLNLFTEDEIAIVTNIPGTTRDLLSGETQFRGVKYKFIDTAGIRESEDEIEKIGIERGARARSKADLILLVIDSNLGFSAEDLNLIQFTDKERILVLANKIDSGASKKEQILSLATQLGISQNLLFVSAIDLNTREFVLGNIFQKFSLEDTGHDVVLNQSRQLEGLLRSKKSITDAITMFKQGDGYEYIALELKNALLGVQDVLGKRYDDDVMDKFFSDFCIEK